MNEIMCFVYGSFFASAMWVISIIYIKVSIHEENKRKAVRVCRTKRIK